MKQNEVNDEIAEEGLIMYWDDEIMVVLFYIVKYGV